MGINAGRVGEVYGGKDKTLVNATLNGMRGHFVYV